MTGNRQLREALDPNDEKHSVAARLAFWKGRLVEFLTMKKERPIDPCYWDMHHERQIRDEIAALSADAPEVQPSVLQPSTTIMNCGSRVHDQASGREEGGEGETSRREGNREAAEYHRGAKDPAGSGTLGAAQPGERDRLREALHKAIGDCCFRDGTIASWLQSPSDVERHVYERLAALSASAPGVQGHCFTLWCGLERGHEGHCEARAALAGGESKPKRIVTWLDAAELAVGRANTLGAVNGNAATSRNGGACSSEKPSLINSARFVVLQKNFVGTTTTKPESIAARFVSVVTQPLVCFAIVFRYSFGRLRTYYRRNSTRIAC